MVQERNVSVIPIVTEVELETPALSSFLPSGASINDVRKIFGLFDPLPHLSTFGTGLSYKIHATTINASAFPWPSSDADILYGCQPRQFFGLCSFVVRMMMRRKINRWREERREEFARRMLPLLPWSVRPITRSLWVFSLALGQRIEPLCRRRWRRNAMQCATLICYSVKSYRVALSAV